MKNEEVLRFYENNKCRFVCESQYNRRVAGFYYGAMAHRIPAIATEVGGTPEIVIDGTNGVLLSSDFSNEQLVNAIKKIYF